MSNVNGSKQWVSPIGMTVEESIATKRAEDPEYRRLNDYYRPMRDLATAVILRRGALGTGRPPDPHTSALSAETSVSTAPGPQRNTARWTTS